MTVTSGTRRSGRNLTATCEPADDSNASNKELPSNGAAGPNRECTRKPS